jgi:hypothetical protein
MPAKVKFIHTSTTRHAILSADQIRHTWGLLDGSISVRQVASKMGCIPPTMVHLRRWYLETDSVSDRLRPGQEIVTSSDVGRHIVIQLIQERIRTGTKST